jgi:uncharacterized protein YggE
MRAAAVLLVLAGAIALGARAPARAQSAPAALPPAIKVEGQASAEVTPDLARLSLGVVADRPSASAAASEVGKAAQAMVEQIKAEGIDDKDVVTTSVTLMPVYPDAAPGHPSAVRAVGARGGRPPRAGAVAAHLVDKGANTIEGIAYASSQEPAVLDRLRGEAMRDARRQAEIYVEALGLKLGRVLEIVPEGGRFVVQGGVRMAAGATAPIPVEPGALPVRASVSVRWEILQ